MRRMRFQGLLMGAHSETPAGVNFHYYAGFSKQIPGVTTCKCQRLGRALHMV